MSVRDDAILILAVCASAALSAPEYGSTSDAAEALGFESYFGRLNACPPCARWLAFRAWDAAFSYQRADIRATYAEAEAMLRCGWEP